MHRTRFYWKMFNISPLKPSPKIGTLPRHLSLPIYISHLSLIVELTLSWFVLTSFCTDTLYCTSEFLNFQPIPNLRVFHSKQLLQPLAKTVSHYNSFFFISAVRLWNSLPRDILLLDSLSLFKSSLNPLNPIVHF